MMSIESLVACVQKFPFHKHVLIGDPGYQLPCMDLGGTNITEEALAQLGPVFKFDTNFRCKCDKLASLLTFMRRLIDKGCDETDIFSKIKHLLEPSNVCTFEDVLENYNIEDMILVSRISKPFEFVAEYTNPLSVKCDTQKFLVRGTDRKYSNGDIVISDTPPSIAHEDRHAFTIHSVQGETAESVLYIDMRRLWSLQVWYTALSRAQWLHQIKLVQHQMATVIGTIIKANMYRIWSPNTHLCYIGHTILSLLKRLKEHETKMDCSSRKIIECGDARIELIEVYEGKSRQDVLDREAWLIQNTPNVVNSIVPISTVSVDESVNIPPPEPPVSTQRIGMEMGATGQVERRR